MEVYVNGERTVIKKGQSVLEACQVAGIDVPRFCYHQRLSVAGNCRMCLVEVSKRAERERRGFRPWADGMPPPPLCPPLPCSERSTPTPLPP
jgi:NADH dehydrogenase/NADH:ubiquinone oxidoreductase subunit G